MNKTYIISCPMCGALINYVAGETTTVCTSCKITIYLKRGHQDINPHLKYAIETNSDTFEMASDCKLVKFCNGDDSDYFIETKSPRLDAETLSKLDSLIYELNVNFSGDIKLGPQELERRTKIVEEILNIDEDNIYGRFIKDIVATCKRKLEVFKEIFMRVDALVIQDYILSFMPLDVGEDQDSVVYFQPIIKYIMHTDITLSEKYTKLINLVQRNKPFKNNKPLISEITDLEYSENITKGYKLLFSSLVKLDSTQEKSLHASKVLREHFNGLYNIDIIKLFINFLIQSNIEYTKKIELITNFLGEDIPQFDSFGDCYQLLCYINNIGFERFTESRLSQIALRKCTPKNLTFEGYAVLNRFIKDSRLRFEETYRLYLRFCDTLLFKQSIIKKLYYKKIFDKDDMLLFINCVRVFARLSLISDDRLNTMRFNEEAIERLGLGEYTESVIKYHNNKIEKITKWSKLDKDSLILKVLIEKKSLLGDTVKESFKEREVGDIAFKDCSKKMKKISSIIKTTQIISCAILSIFILIICFNDSLKTSNIIFVAFTGLFFSSLMVYFKIKKYSLEIYIVTIIGLLVVATLASFITSNIYISLALVLFTLLKIPLFYALGYLLFDPIYKFIIFKDKIIYDTLMNEDRLEKFEYRV